jgi:hypothetical protein
MQSFLCCQIAGGGLRLAAQVACNEAHSAQKIRNIPLRRKDLALSWQ